MLFDGELSRDNGMYYGIVCGVLTYDILIASPSILVFCVVLFIFFFFFFFNDRICEKCMVVIMYVLKNHVVLGGSDAKNRSNEYDSNTLFC